jgi:hypothetical protein
MEEPDLLSEESLAELKELQNSFPFFHAATMLYLKNLAKLEHIQFSQELKSKAVSVPDRKQLFLLIEGERYGIYTTAEEAAQSEKEDTFSLIDSFLNQRDGNKQSSPEDALLVEPSFSSDYMLWTLAKGFSSNAKEEAPPLQHQDLIDSFIEEDEKRQPGSLLEPGEEGSSEADTRPESVKELDDAYLQMLDDSYFTETLARIYIKQRRYDKALQIIKKLSLKYPEKNTYFADQIRFLEKLIINNTK